MTAPPPPFTPWSAEAAEVMDAVGATHDGLASDLARARLAESGRNEFPAAPPVRAWQLLVRQFLSPLVFILLLAAGVTLALREYADTAVIAAVLVLNAAIGFAQEFRAERSMEALRRLARNVARVVREGREHLIDAAELVPGDIVLIEAGGKVPADCRVVHAVAFDVDESLLTGESTTVEKTALPCDAAAPIGDRTSMLFMGSIATAGHCRAVVTATGPATELGRVTGAVSQIGEVQTPLQRRMESFARMIGLAVLSAAGIGLLLGAAAGEDLGELFFAVVALAVSAIPEGLPVVLTIALAISVRRMVARNVIIRSLPAVEALGSCTVIGSDKTGTLTENRMTVHRIDVASRSYEIDPHTPERALPTAPNAAVELVAGSTVHRVLLAGVLCNNASAVPADDGFDVQGDPTEIALLIAAAATGIYKDAAEDLFPRVGEVPFAAERRFAASFNRNPDGSTTAWVKGSPEEVLAMCTSGAGVAHLDRREILRRAERMAGEGLRVLALASGAVSARTPDDPVGPRQIPTLGFLGLVGMFDPPREETRAALRACERAGIRVVMITGDHAATARSIARRLGIGGPTATVLTGIELDALRDDDFASLAPQVSIYARVSPQHKLRIVTTLQRLGETVAVTGDGVNDAPALKAADIGAAMGRSGTDVAKEAADMVVTDDNFASIVAAVREGRVAFDNIRKTTFYLISSGLAEVLAVLCSIALPFRLPFLPVQLLWLNLVTNGVQDVALAFEPGERDVLERAPRARSEGVISRLLWVRTVLVGIVMAAGTLLWFLVELGASGDIDRARTIAVTTMVVFQIIHVGNCRSEFRSAFAVSPFSNPLLLAGTAMALALHVGAMHWGPTRELLHLEPLDAFTWLRIGAISLTAIAAVEVHKLITRHRRPVGDPTPARLP